MLRLAYFVVCALFLFSSSALAYIDPASTSYIVQIIAGVFIAGGAAIGIYWHKIKLFFRKRKEKKLQQKNGVTADVAADAGESISAAAERMEAEAAKKPDDRTPAQP